MNYKVKNINDATNYIPPIGYISWLDFWEKKANQTAVKCHAIDCNATQNLVGGHVYLDNKIYIVPLCTNCNKRTGEFFVTGPLIPME